MKRAWLVVALVSGALFLALAAHAWRQELLAVDVALGDSFKGPERVWLRPTMKWLSLLGSYPVLIVLALVSLLALWRRDRKLALLFPVVMAGGFPVEQALKFLVWRPRPHLTAAGFPSGHSFTAVVWLGALVYLLWRSGANRGWRTAGTVAALLAIVAVACARVYLGVHWPSDVLGGVTGGLAYLAVTLWWVEGRLQTAARGAPGFPVPSPDHS
ncbi:MAG: phosphatase PAP2 family protein [Candidatus Rokubacteria bacterium]|nr:phosphatase PAP2 family protein [Candidatus Rokubacteria bacterium]MBI3827628.1 phosphatase PAP2 family protein [Candidatus Rokubacteria bacterium]